MKLHFNKKHVLGLFSLIVGVIFIMQPFAVMAMDKVDMRLHWKVNSEHVPFIVAMDKGFYKQEGIDITVREGAGSTKTLKLIGAGKETFGICGTNVTVKGAIQGVPVKQIMLMEADKTNSVISRPDAGIKAPKDLKGKIIAGSGSGVSDIFEAFLAKNNMTMKDITYLAAGRARLQAVASGKAHGTLGIAMNDPTVLKGMGITSPDIILLSDWGAPEIGNGVIAHEDTIKKNPDLVKRFVRATIRGINHTIMDPEGAAKIAVKHFPMTKKETLLSQFKTYRWRFLPPLGWQNPKEIQAMADMMAEYGGLAEAKDYDINKCFTNEFVPEP